MPYYRLFYHYIWATKERLPLIGLANQDEIFNCINAKSSELGGIIHALNAMPDHVHLVATVPPRVSLSEFVGQIKGASSHLANALSQTSREAPPFAWQTEYGVLSITESHLPIVVNYVRNQQEHHARGTLRVRLERIGTDKP